MTKVKLYKKECTTIKKVELTHKKEKEKKNSLTIKLVFANI